MQSILIALLIIAWFWDGHYKGAWQRFKSRSFGIYWILYFFVFVFSIFYSDDITAAYNDIFRKVSFLLLPIFLLSAKDINQNSITQIHRAFVIGCLAAFFICIGGAFIFPVENDSQAFFNDALAGYTHNNAVNLSAKCFYALLFMLNYKKPFQKLKEGQTLIIFILFAFLFLLVSKTILSLTIIFLFAFSFKSLTSGFKKRRIVRWSFLVFSAFFIFIMLGKDNPIQRRFHNLSNIWESTWAGEAQDISMADNFTKRKALWLAAKENLLSKDYFLLGTGIGDWQQVQNDKLSDVNFEIKNYKNLSSLSNLNVHNMYLQSWLSAGILALIILLLLSVVLFVYAMLKKQYWWAQFLFLFCIMLMQESSFQTQSGIVFFCFFHLIFMYAQKIKWNFKTEIN